MELNSLNKLLDRYCPTSVHYMDIGHDPSKPRVIWAWSPKIGLLLYGDETDATACDSSVGHRELILDHDSCWVKATWSGRYDPEKNIVSAFRRDGGSAFLGLQPALRKALTGRWPQAVVYRTDVHMTGGMLIC